MNLVDLLFNAAGGGVVGSLLHLGTSFLDTWKKKKEAETQIMLMKAQSEMAANAAAWTAFANSQNTTSPFTVPANAPGWVGAVYTLVQALKEATRPGLCWALLAVLTMVYFSSTGDVRAKITDEMTFGAFTAVFWYFGSRYTQRTK